MRKITELKEKQEIALGILRCGDSADDYRINQGAVEDTVCVAVLF